MFQEYQTLFMKMKIFIIKEHDLNKKWNKKIFIVFDGDIRTDNQDEIEASVSFSKYHFFWFDSIYHSLKKVFWLLNVQVKYNWLLKYSSFSMKYRYQLAFRFLLRTYKKHVWCSYQLQERAFWFKNFHVHFNVFFVVIRFCQFFDEMFSLYDSIRINKTKDAF
jgi:hypothetical protein